MSATGDRWRHWYFFQISNHHKPLCTKQFGTLEDYLLWIYFYIKFLYYLSNPRDNWCYNHEILWWANKIYLIKPATKYIFFYASSLSWPQIKRISGMYVWRKLSTLINFLFLKIIIQIKRFIFSPEMECVIINKTIIL